MKRILIAVLIVVAFTGFLFAQGWVISGGEPKQFVDSKKPPPLSLPDAYSAALAFVGPATNRLWCVSAACDPDYGTTVTTHWKFGFANTNREITEINVFFDKVTCRQMGAICEGIPLKQ